MSQLTEIIEILSTRGHQQYGGEPVSQLEHALQCAFLAEQADASQAMIIACLLHDFGHLVDNLGETNAERGCHEHRCLKWLKPLFDESVTEPIRLHVEAKRYLCHVDLNYFNTLSDASKLSLKLQGGVFSEQEALNFIHQPYASEAIQLRRWDEQAKIPHLQTPSLEDYFSILIEFNSTVQTIDFLKQLRHANGCQSGD